MEITFKPSQKQFEAWEYLSDKETTEVGYGGAAFGGKSYLGCVWQVSQRLAYPKSAGLLGRKDLINLKRTTLVTFFKVCDDFGLKPDVHFKYNQQNNTVTFENGSVEYLFDLSYQPSDPLFTRLGGLELTDAFVDESNEVMGQCIEILKTRIGRRMNKEYDLLPKLLEGFNPDKGHVYQRYYKPWRDNVLPLNRKFIKALPTDNPTVTEDYLNQLRNSDKTTRERLLLGNFEYDDDPASLIEYDAMVDLFTNTAEPSKEKYLSIDVARKGQDKTVFYLWEGLAITKMKWFEKQLLDQTEEEAKKWAREEQIPFSHIIADEDGVGGGLIDHMRGIKGFVNNSSPLDNPVTHKPDNFQNLKTQCYYKLADYINDHKIAILVNDEKFKSDLIEELEQVKGKDIDKDGKRRIVPKEDVKAVLGRSPDFSDALMMRMWFELKKGNGEIAFSYIPGNLNRNPSPQMDKMFMTSIQLEAMKPKQANVYRPR